MRDSGRWLPRWDPSLKGRVVSRLRKALRAIGIGAKAA